jgi:hypothetical protein
MRLKNRIKSIPGGFRFVQPETNWHSQKALGRNPSWEVLIGAVIAMRNANPHQREKHSWRTDVEGVADEVDEFNAKICLDNGWKQFVAGADRRPIPIPPPTPYAQTSNAVVSSIRKLWTGLKTTSDWLESGEAPVAIELAEKRAATCVACPLNAQGNFSDWFTKPAANAIARQIAKLSERSIKTSQDDKLQVCKACLCPLRLKVHAPIAYIQAHISDEVLSALKAGKDCWILSEIGK